MNIAAWNSHGGVQRLLRRPLASDPAVPRYETSVVKAVVKQSPTV
jgi:hypothetical protein